MTLSRHAFVRLAAAFVAVQAGGLLAGCGGSGSAAAADMVATCESRADVQRYAWFTGRRSPDSHFTSLLGADGALAALGSDYLALPFRGGRRPC